MSLSTLMTIYCRCCRCTRVFRLTTLASYNASISTSKMWRESNKKIKSIRVRIYLFCVLVSIYESSTIQVVLVKSMLVSVLVIQLFMAVNTMKKYVEKSSLVSATHIQVLTFFIRHDIIKYMLTLYDFCVSIRSAQLFQFQGS